MIVKVKEKRGRCNGGIGAVKHAIMYFHGNGGTKAEIFGIVSELN